MSRNTIELAVLALALAAFFAVGFWLGRGRRPDAPDPGVQVVTDTLYVRDTITVSRPVYIARKVVEKDTIRLTDTMRVHDTLAVVLDREQLEWRDSLCAVWASGIHPAVDSVRHYVTTQVVTNTVTVPVVRKTRWGVGVQAGYGISDKGLTPYVGAGLSYNLISF